jgi:HAD superfamily hydrolase (TIGR01509 family)
MIAAVAFDLDGTLIASERRWERARHDVTESGGGTWRETAQPEMMGLSTPEWIAFMQNDLGTKLSADEIFEGVLERLEASYRSDLPLIPGADDAVRRLGERWPLAVASSSPRRMIELVLELAGLADCFSVVLSSEEVERGKPSPDVYLEACRLLGSEPEQTAAIEDSGAGVRAAKAAAMPVVLIPERDFPPPPEIPELADVVLDSITELDAPVVENL